MEPALQPARHADLDVLMEFMHQYYLHDGHPFEPSAARRAFNQFLQDPALGRAWLICDGRTPVGYIVLTLGYSLEFHGPDAFIDEFFLLASHRNRGWGSQVLAHVEAAARELGVQAIHLEVVRANTAASGFYRKAGYCDRNHYLMTKKLQQE